MSGLFGRKNSGGEKTVAIVDIENGSVGAALVRLSSHDAPKLFGETRILLPLVSTQDVRTLAHETEKALHLALAHISEVASRVRTHEVLASTGEVERVAGFFSVPWASMHLAGGGADFMPQMSSALLDASHDILGGRPLTMHPYGAAAAHGATVLFPQEAPTILCIVSGETAELLVIDRSALKARATIPVGLHTLLRTLMSHGGASAAEARSLLALTPARGHAGFAEPLAHAQSHFAREFADVARPLLKTAPIENVLVVAPQGAEEWFARALAQPEHDGLADLFPEGSTVRAMRAGHAQPYLSAHAAKPDLPLMLEALFVDQKLGV